MKIELNEHTKRIFGMMCFEAGPIAHAMRDAGVVKLKSKAEDEQATVIHWMLNLYLEYGDDWRKKAGEELQGWLKKIEEGKTTSDDK